MGSHEGWMVVGGDARLGMRCAMGRRLWMVSRGSVRTAARRRTGTESGAEDPVCVEMDLHDLRRREACVLRGEKSHYACYMCEGL